MGWLLLTVRFDVRRMHALRLFVAVAEIVESILCMV